MTCENCYHYKICSQFGKIIEEYARVDFLSFLFFQTTCKDFKDKSRIVELPMPAAEWLRRELTEHCYNRCMEEL